MENLGEIRKVIEHHKEISDKQRGNDDMYRVDIYDASRYFESNPRWEKKIEEYFKEIHSVGENVVYVDICGRASGVRLGADKTYTFSLKTPETRKIISQPGDIFIDGDIFNSKDFFEFITIIEDGGVPPALVTFRPIVGLEKHDPELQSKNILNYNKEVTYQQLIKRLQKMISVLRPGGYIFLEKPFQTMGIKESVGDVFSGERTPQDQWEISLAIKKLIRELKCKIEIDSEIGGPHFLIRKPLNKVKK